MSNERASNMSSTPAEISCFRGEYSFLSNFYHSPFTINGLCWKTVEHAYQAAKAKNGKDMRRIACCATPAEAKRIGGQIDIKPNWDARRVGVMRILVLEKFRQNPHLLKKLLATGTVNIVEGNTWGDIFWGVCYGHRGRNELGKILMYIRQKLG